MPRATWKGVISFGLVSIPVSLYSGSERDDMEFNMVDSRDQARIRNRRVNEQTGEEVPWEQIARVYELEKGSQVILNKEDFERAAIEATHAINVDAFVERAAIQPVFFEKPYIVTPEPGGEKAYVLLREALQGTGKAGIGKIVIRGRQYLVALVAQDSAILALRMRFAQELVDAGQIDLPGKLPREYGVTAKELETAEQLIQAMSQDWQPARYQDDYREALLAWIKRKARVGEVAGAPEVPTTEEKGEPINIMDLLQRSLEEVQSR